MSINEPKNQNFPDLVSALKSIWTDWRGRCYNANNFAIACFNFM